MSEKMSGGAELRETIRDKYGEAARQAAGGEVPGCGAVEESPEPVDSSCCGNADFTAALVPGYIIGQPIANNKDGLSVSEVEPITDKTTREKIKKIIQETEHISQVEFW